MASVERLERLLVAPSGSARSRPRPPRAVESFRSAAPPSRRGSTRPASASASRNGSTPTRDDHELLDVHVVVGVGAAVQHVEHGDGQHLACWCRRGSGRAASPWSRRRRAPPPSETPSMALAPSLDLFSVASISIMARSIATWARTSRPRMPGAIVGLDVGDRRSARPSPGSGLVSCPAAPALHGPRWRRSRGNRRAPGLRPVRRCPPRWWGCRASRGPRAP